MRNVIRAALLIGTLGASSVALADTPKADAKADAKAGAKVDAKATVKVDAKVDGKAAADAKAGAKTGLYIQFACLAKTAAARCWCNSRRLRGWSLRLIRTGGSGRFIYNTIYICIAIN